MSTDIGVLLSQKQTKDYNYYRNGIVRLSLSFQKHLLNYRIVFLSSVVAAKEYIIHIVAPKNAVSVNFFFIKH
jgi:hypothetical protein